LKHRALDTTNLDSSDNPVARDPRRRASGVQARAKRQSSRPPQVVAKGEPPPLISIGSPADPALLEPTYAYLSSYTFLCLAPRVAERLNVAIYELYANALRYGSSAGEVRLEIERNHRDGSARLRVSNHAEPEQLERLNAQLARVQADAAAAFAAEMNRFAGGSEPPPMLGLVRVAHESALVLAAKCDGDRVELSTVCTS
jgi:signal transduction histidine kinase